MSEIVVGLDIGTHKVCTIVGEVREQDIYVIGVGITPSQGMKKGVVNDIQALSNAITTSVKKAEQTSGYQIRRAFVSIAGGHISSMTSRGMAGITTSRGVNEADLEKALDAARAIAIPHNREVLHVIPRSYTLDGQEGVRHPIGMHCFRLEVDAHIITASSTSLANLEQAAQLANVYVDRFILNPLAAGKAVLTDLERESGVAVIDIGGGTADIAIYINGTPWHTAVIALGGNHVTHDITYWMHVPFGLAETVKIEHGHADMKSVDALERFHIEPFGDGMPQEIERRELAMVIEARVEEIFEELQKEIKRSGYDGLLRAGAVITGGAAQLPGTKTVAERILKCPIRIAHPEKITGMVDQLKSPSYSTSVGLLRTGLDFDDAGSGDNSAGQRPTIPGEGLMGMMGNFLKRLLPDDGDV